MSTAELTYGALELTVPPRSRAAITTDMLEVSQLAGDSLDEFSTHKLTGLTAELLSVEGDDAISEYSRYAGVASRGLDIDRSAIAEKVAGKNILVTGGTGLIGSALLEELSSFEPAHLASISRGITEPQNIQPEVDYFNGDIRNPDDVQAAITAAQPDIIFHVAADKYNHAAEARARHTLTTNIEGTKNVLDAAQANDVGQLVYASTGKATRPFSPDIYASSKKTGEWLVTDAVDKGLLASAVRFTHVVDNSNVSRIINKRIDEELPVTLQSPDVLFYIQSAKESAHLLLNSLLEAEPGVLHVQAIRDLAMPINLLDLGLGAVAHKQAEVPIYFSGVQQGYEDTAWPGLYDPMTGGDVSPLINSLEAPEAVESDFCPAVDTFPLHITASQETEQRLAELLEACHDTADNAVLRTINQALGWAMLEDRLKALPQATLARSAKRVAKFTVTETLSDEHIRTGQFITTAFAATTAN